MSRCRVAGMLGGRAAEQVVFGDVTTGAESDLEQATALARPMVGRWGMSQQVGPMSVLPDPRREQPNRQQLEMLVTELLEHETLHAGDLYRATGLPAPGAPAIP